MDRSFVIESAKTPKSNLRPHPGRYISKTPNGAVRKMFTTLSKGKHANLTITCRETTRGSAGKSYTYRVKRINNETVVEINGEDIVFKYSTKTKAL